MPAQGGRRGAVVERLARGNAAGLLYGGVVAAASVAVVSSHAERGLPVLVGVSGVLVTYWLAHVYVQALTDRLAGTGPGLTHHLRRAFRHESSVLVGGVPALVLFSVEVLLGVPVGTAGDVALWFSVLLLAAVGYLAAHSAGLRGRALAAETGVAALFGVAAVALKSLLH